MILNLSGGGINRFVFLLYDYKTNTVLNFQIYDGKSCYKEFNKFIRTGIMSNFENSSVEKENFTILVPRNYVSKQTVQLAQMIRTIILEGYSQYEDMPKMMKTIKTYIKGKNLRDISAENFSNLINSLNIKISMNLESYTCNNDINHKRMGLSTVFLRKYSTVSSTKCSNKAGGFKWETYKSVVMNPDLFDLSGFVSKFWLEVVKPTTNDRPEIKIAIQLKGVLEDLGVRSITHVDTIDVTQQLLVLDAFKHRLNQTSENYNASNRVCQLIIVYKVLGVSSQGRITTPYTTMNSVKPSYNKKNLGSQIPPTMDIKDWGPITENSNTKALTIKLNTNIYAEVNIKDNMNFVSIYEKRLTGKLQLFTFVDVLRLNKNAAKPDYQTFNRVFNDKIISFVNGEISLNVDDIKCKYIDNIQKQGSPNNKIITMDLETREINGVLDPVCVSIYDGKIKKTFWVADFVSSHSMLETAIGFLLIRKYYGYKLYLHNFSYFDGVFLLKVLANMSEINLTKALIRDGRILKLGIQYDKSKNTPKTKSGSYYKGNITIHDSLLILPASLEKLTKVFNCESKGMFPLKLINNPSIALNYKGDIPDMKYFYHPNPITQNKAYIAWLEKYNDYILSFNLNAKWDLKQELVKYCEQDVVSLHMVITTFTKEIYNRFKVDILNYPTLPSIAFAIYRLNYMPSDTIPIITGGVYNDIKKSYYGGFVDVYKVWAENVHGFDVNSLYPSSMEKFAIPVGKGKFFEGDYSLWFKDIFGFVLVEVNAPKNLKRPILPHKIINSDGSQSTIYPVGTWIGWYFTEEIKNAMKYGYEFKIIKGYHFEGKKLFTKYIQELYAIKSSVSPDNPWYTISKLLQNSLYGRFGMSPNMDKNEFFDVDSFDTLLRSGDKDIKDQLDLGSKILVTYSESSVERDPNVSVGVAAAIASWSRIQMTHYIMKYGDSICYIDTDGIKTTSMIDPSEVGTKLGMMKYEGTLKEAVFIAPKVYGGISENLEMTVKVKGLKNPITYWKLKLLLYMDKLEISQDKWVREWNKGSISILNQIYTLSATENKRHIIRDSCGKIVATRPFELLNGLKVTPDTYMLYYFPILLEHKLLQAPQTIDWNLRLNSGPNIIYLPEPLPAVIYLSSPLADIIYLSDPVLHRLAAPYLVPIMFRLSVPHMPLSLPSPCQSEISIKSIPIKSITVKVSVSDNIDNTITIHPSIRAAARSLKISDSTIRRYLKSERKTFVKGRYSFNYVS